MREYQSGFSDFFRRFVRYREASGKWNKGSDSILASFDRFCASHSPNRSIQNLMETWCARRDTESTNAHGNRIGVINGLVRYLNSRGLAELSEIEVPKAVPVSYIPHTFTQQELRGFFAVCDALAGSARSRKSRIESMVIPTIFRLLYSSGIRTCEARMLGVGDVDLNTGILNIRDSKGPDQHYVVLHESMLEIMKQYDVAIEKYCPARDYFFPDAKGKPYTAPWLSMKFRNLWDGVSQSYARAYDLRHHYATTNINSWRDAGYDFFDKLTYLGKSMGHRSLESTAYYYSLVPSLADTLSERSESCFNDIIPEVCDDENTH